jgi:hypothetical protein
MTIRSTSFQSAAPQLRNPLHGRTTQHRKTRRVKYGNSFWKHPNGRTKRKTCMDYITSGTPMARKTTHDMLHTSPDCSCQSRNKHGNTFWPPNIFASRAPHVALREHPRLTASFTQNGKCTKTAARFVTYRVAPTPGQNICTRVQLAEPLSCLHNDRPSESAVQRKTPSNKQQDTAEQAEVTSI